MAEKSKGKGKNSRKRAKPRGYGVYVIELKSEANEHMGVDSSLPVVYVGQSWHPAVKRFRIHMTGEKWSSKIVRKFGRRLRPDLYRGLRRVATRDEAEALEAAHAHTLAGDGY